MTRRAAFGCFTASLLMLAATSAQAQLSATAEWATRAQNQYAVQANVTYLSASGMDAKLDVYRRRDVTTPQPTLVFYHGGGWVLDRKSTRLNSSH